MLFQQSWVRVQNQGMPTIYEKYWKWISCFFPSSPNKPWGLRVYSVSLLKILWEKEKLLVTGNFSFSHSVFYPFEELSAILITFEIFVCKLVEFVKSKICCLDLTKFKAFADNQWNIGRIMISFLDRVENIVGKWENAGYQNFLLFPHCFQKAASLGLLNVGIAW